MSHDRTAAGTHPDVDRLQAALDRVEPRVVRVCSWAIGLFVLFFTYLFVASAAGLGVQSGA